MKKILIFGGTTEGRQIAEVLSQNKIHCEVCVATQYGEDVLCENQFIHVKKGRLTAQMMALLYESGYAAVVDATHPYADEVSKNIKKSVAAFNKKGNSLPLFRIDRITSCNNDRVCAYFKDAFDCAKRLAEENGNILLTTGTKELEVFCANEQLKKKIIARVLPSLESLEECKKNGLDGRQIIAMQGPFSVVMNFAQLQDYKISVLVTKESGATGGFEEKLAAAKKAGTKIFVIKKPELNYDDCEAERFASVEELFLRLQEVLCQKIGIAKNSLKITIAGLGMGSIQNATCEVLDAIKNADFIFGAERLLQTAATVNQSAKKYPYYLAKDIIPVLKELKSSHGEQKGGAGKSVNAVILFSGDIGFYSGAEGFYSVLKASDLKEEKIVFLPGISCVQYLAAKFHTNWQNSQILNLHGVNKDDWRNKLFELVYKTRQIYFILSSFTDVRALGEALSDISSSSELKITVNLGFQLSYPDEKLMTILPKECEKISTLGLYSGIIMVANEKG